MRVNASILMQYQFKNNMIRFGNIKNVIHLHLLLIIIPRGNPLFIFKIYCKTSFIALKHHTALPLFVSHGSFP